MAKIEYEIRGQVAYITLNRPEVRNALDREMVGTLHELWQEFQSSGSARVAVLTGAGGHFCAGYDVKAINSRQDAGIPFEWSRSSMFGDKRIGPDGHGVTKPIIAALDGSVNGAGFWLALQSDIRLATDRARFGLGEARFGFPVEFAALISNYVPRAVAMEMLFALKVYDARRFHELGIINEIVDGEHLMEKARDTAEALLERGPLAIMAMKELINFDPNYKEKIRFTAEKVVPVVNSEDTKEAVRAFVEKRKPEWKLR
ncbi:MAG: enoyl-CoA hydratase/isomerase family protein [Deltaproteobacteria bacterium]|nr:enoyl-CoA hydratase/isomerase family protein [Deltaproteobacteria bacterium]MBW2120238.1 enoyl-CoA hydratase/isomerase family protein [Deltaproteobacteria bacterium]